MTDTDGLKFVVGWSLGGIVASSLVLGALLSLQQSQPPSDGVVTERSLDRLDQKTCRQVMEDFIEQSRSGAQIIWLWAEESTPRVFGATPRTKQVVEVANPPRPYAFHPTTQAVPAGACSFPSNSLHVVAVETKEHPDGLISNSIE